METLSFIVLILLSLVGYSGGAAGKAGKLAEVKPQLVDLIIVLLIWTGAIYSNPILRKRAFFSTSLPFHTFYCTLPAIVRMIDK